MKTIQPMNMARQGLLGYSPYRPQVNPMQARAMPAPAPRMEQEQDMPGMGQTIAMLRKREQDQTQNRIGWQDPGSVPQNMGPRMGQMPPQNPLRDYPTIQAAQNNLGPQMPPGAQTFPAYPPVNNPATPLPPEAMGVMQGQGLGALDMLKQQGINPFQGALAQGQGFGGLLPFLGGRFS